MGKLLHLTIIWPIFLLITSSVLGSAMNNFDNPMVGVKEGDWIEYEIKITGTGIMPPTHDVNWMKIDVLTVHDTAFSINLTSRYTNGTLGSAIWKFNFTEGEVGGWIIIPSNLNPGDRFYDLSRHTEEPVNVTIQGEEQKEVLGATRIITHGNDSLRQKKEWDKITGVFIGSIEHLHNVTNKDGWYIEDLTVTTNAIATNIWNPQIMGIDQQIFYSLIALAILPISSILIFLIIKTDRKGIIFPFISQGKIVILSIIFTILLEIAIILFFPFQEIGMTFPEFNLIMQTIWTIIVLLSMWYRKKGNYLMHEITLLIVMDVWLVGFSAVIFMDPFSLLSLEVFSNTLLRLIMNILHGVFSIPALVFGIWLVALWRPESKNFPRKTKRLAQLTTIFWILSYIVGVLDFMVLHTTIFG